MTELIVAVDGYSYDEAKGKGVLDALKIAKERKLIWGIKISDMLFSGSSPEIIRDLKGTYGLSVFADAKLHDIPNTIENSLRRLVGSGADLVSVHLSSLFRPRDEELLKHIAGFTVLTSFTDLQVRLIYERRVEDLVKDLADVALSNSYRYIVLPVRALDLIRDYPLKKICSGIRPHWFPDRKDQISVASVREAQAKGADYIVIGRPIMESRTIIEAIEKVHQELL